MESKHIYIAAQFTDLTNFMRDAIQAAESWYSNMGYQVTTPIHIEQGLLETHNDLGLNTPIFHDYLVAHISAAIEADEMVILPNYKNDPDASLMILLAEKAGIPIYHAFSYKRAELKAHVCVITAYDKLVNAGRISTAITAQP